VVPGDIHDTSQRLNASIHVREIFREHAQFVWRVLARAGVPDADLKDASQEVFIVVANKLGDLTAETTMTSWLYGISVRIAANHRRKVQRKREELTDRAAETLTADDRESPEARVARAESCARLAEILDRLSPEQRIVFELFELEEMTCQAIADALKIPLGTTYTRLRAARAALQARVRELTDEEATS